MVARASAFLVAIASTAMERAGCGPVRISVRFAECLSSMNSRRKIEREQRREPPDSAYQRGRGVAKVRGSQLSVRDDPAVWRDRCRPRPDVLRDLERTPHGVQDYYAGVFSVLWDRKRGKR